MERADRLRELTTGELYSNLGLDLDQAVEDLKQDPTADIANRARKGLKEVLIVARTSKNLKGGHIKELKNAAVMATAALEVLRTRSENDKDSDVLRQVRALKIELEAAKQAAARANEEIAKFQAVARANEEIAKLQAEIAKLQAKKGRRRASAKVILSDLDSDSDSPDVRENRKNRRWKDTPIPSDGPNKKGSQHTDMEIDFETGTGPASVTTQEREYDDEKRKKEILPPQEEWPPAMRPSIQGKIKVLEDRVLVGHKMKVTPAKKEATEGNKERTITSLPETKEDDPADGVQRLLKSLTPALENWLNNSLKAYGIERKSTTAGAKQKGTTAVTKTQSSVVPRSRNTSLKRGKKPSQSNRQAVTQDPPVQDEGTWSTVVSRRAKNKSQPATTTAAKNSNPGKPAGPGNTNKRTNETQARRLSGTESQQKITQRGETGNKKSANKRRPPRTAAVTLTCPPDSYALAMRKVREKIQLEDLGIEALKPRKAVTGALILEIQGPDGKNKARALKEKIEEALQEVEGAKVSRPEKLTEIRVKDIVDSTDISEVRDAIASAGECTVGEIKTGEIRKSSYGLGTLWVQCPIRAVNKIAALGKFRVGWTSSRVELLTPRQLHCYRCLGRGHVQANCTSADDRSGLCYRCGGIGHQAKQCGFPPLCPVCQEAGLQASHRVGGPACKAPAKSRKSGEPGNRGTLEEGKETGNAQPAVRGGPTATRSAPVPVRLSKEKETPKKEGQT